MKYKNTIEATFVSRPNRFIAFVKLSDSQVVRCHVKNTGRCRELLLPGARVVLEDFRDRLGKRQTEYDLIAVYKGELLINIDSQAPNEAAFEYVTSGRYIGDVENARREVTYGNSRFDIYFEKNNQKYFLEVKGVTLEKNGVVSFPDAPTIRGLKHLDELILAKDNGYVTGVLFVVQMNWAKYFIPQYETHRAFGEKLKQAYEAGVNLTAVLCDVTENEIIITDKIPIRF